MLKGRKKGVAGSRSEEFSTRVLPPSPLFPGADGHGSEGSNGRSVWAIALIAAATTILVVGLGAGAFAVYHSKTSDISQLQKERRNLRTTNTTLHDQLGTVRGKLNRANARLTKSTIGLQRAKKNLTKLQKDLVAANERAVANYDAGYSDGSSAGYSSGRSAGLVQASDSLVCSDDPDVTWLPYCY